MSCDLKLYMILHVANREKLNWCVETFVSKCLSLCESGNISIKQLIDLIKPHNLVSKGMGAE